MYENLEILKKFRMKDTQPFIYIFLAGFHLDIRKQKYSYLLAVERLYQFDSNHFLSKYLYYKYYQQPPLVLMLWLGMMNKQYSSSPLRMIFFFSRYCPEHLNTNHYVRREFETNKKKNLKQQQWKKVWQKYNTQLPEPEISINRYAEWKDLSTVFSVLTNLSYKNVFKMFKVLLYLRSNPRSITQMSSPCWSPQVSFLLLHRPT